MNKIFLIFVLVIFSQLAFAGDKFNMRDCMMLPITDSAGNALGFKVYERLEEYLKDVKWCEYKSSAPLLGVFSKYRDKLREHLNDPLVIKTVANKMMVGSIIKIELDYLVNNIEVALEVRGENGSDIYFKEKTIIADGKIDEVVLAIRKWLDVYEVNIPYDGKVLGVLGDQITFTVPGNKKIAIGQDFVVRKFENKSEHKLLKTIVEWDSRIIAKGKVFNAAPKQSLGVIKVYTENRKVEQGDWIKLEKIVSKRIIDDKHFGEEDEANKFGKLGTVSVSMGIGSGSVGTAPQTGSVKVAGLSYGIAAEAEAWITRNYFVTGDFSRAIGNYKKSSGSPSLETASITSGYLKIGGGYKYLPMGFFYGPQVNLLAGYARYTYNVESSTADGFGENSISGFYVGIGGSMPVNRDIRIFGRGEIIPFSSFDETDNNFGSTKTSGSMYFKIGAQYQYNPVMTIDGAFEVINNSAKFKSGTSEVNYRSSGLKIGSTFVF